MSRPRKRIPLTTKLAAALAALYLTHDEAVALSEEQILSLVQWDHHPIPHTPPYNGPDVHWNLVPRLIPEARERTAKIDVPRIAKGKRISKAEQAFRDRLLAKSDPDAAQTVPTKPKRQIQSKPFQKRKDKMGWGSKSLRRAVEET